MRKWAYVSEELVVDSAVLPDGLPQDNSLCIAVMGYQLLPDGSMAASPEDIKHYSDIEIAGIRLSLYGEEGYFSKDFDDFKLKETKSDWN